MAGESDKYPERFGPFVLLRMLGAGGMGTAYLALHPESEQLLVVKRMHPELMRESVIFKRFVHEAEVAAHVQHPNVAALVAMGTIDKEPFLATEFVFGIQASRIVDRVEESLIDPVPLGIALHLGVELVSGLQAIHEARHVETGEALGLIHRDVGARNVLIGFDGRVRLIDLGLGKSILSDWHTAHEVLAGSPDYMPPEQAMGAKVDGRADVYAAAVTIWELLAGKKRIREDTVPARLQRAIGAQPEPLLPHRPEASARLEAILKTAMHADPDRRTATAAIFKRTLAEEALAVARRMSREDIIAWLDTACATIIAREKRELEEARASAARALAPARRPNTQLFVGREALSMPAAYELYRPDPRNDELEIVDNPAPAYRSLPARLAAVADLRVLRRLPIAAQLALIATGGMFLVVIATVTAVLVTPKERSIEAVALPPPASRTESVEPPAPPPPPERVAPQDEEVPLIAPPPYRRPPPRRPKLPPAQSQRKKRLLRRIRSLRRVSFEVDWQRQLTRLSARLSRARSEETLDEVEGELFRLERNPP